jgi:hypothetical protein
MFRKRCAMSIRRSCLRATWMALGLVLPLSPLFAADPEIVNEGGIGRRWAAAPGSSFAAPGYPATMLERRAHVCLNVAYTLQEEGIPSDLELLKSWSRDAGNVPLSDGELEEFVQSAAMALTQWRFVPKEPHKRVRATRSSATLVFRGGAGLSNTEIAANCKVSDLAAHIESEDGEAPRRRTMQQIIQMTERQQEHERIEQLMRELALRRAQQDE